MHTLQRMPFPSVVVLMTGAALAASCGSSHGTKSTQTASNSTGSGAGAMAVLEVDGEAYAFVPSPTGIAKLKLTSSGALASAPATLARGRQLAGVAPGSALALTPTPDACAADWNNLKVVCASFGSDTAHVVDAASLSVSSYQLGLTATASFSGGSCIVCGLLYDAADNRMILATAGGYALFDHVGSHKIERTIQASISENFGYDQATNQILSPQYQTSPVTIDLIDVRTGKPYTLAPPPAGLNEPEHGAVDFVTGVAFVTEESGLNGYLLDLRSPQLDRPSAGSFQAPVTTASLQTSIASRLTDVAIDSSAHYAFLSEEFGASMAVARLPTSAGAPLQLGDYAIATVPAPPGATWEGSGDPHGIANFTLQQGVKHYGVLVDGPKTWMAVVDMDKLLAAPRSATSPQDVDASYDLVANGAVTFHQIQ